ncbi:MAG: hypothetical protein WA372_00295 [Candidatus Sulfotelmatobacter sp.]
MPRIFTVVIMFVFVLFGMVANYFFYLKEAFSWRSFVRPLGNGGNKQARAELTILYNHGSEQYRMEQTLEPDEQMLVDLGKQIRNQIPDKQGHVLPVDLTSGTYRIRDLADAAAGGVYEGKVTVDKTYGHAAYGCAVCCGPAAPFMEFNPLPVPVDSFSDQEVEADETCGGAPEDITGDFPTWSTANTAIATAKLNQINGVASGSTTHSATSELMTWGGRQGGAGCPEAQKTSSGPVNVGPYQVEPIDTASQGPAQCTKTGQSGWVRNVTNQVQYVTGSAYAVSGLSVSDDISVGTPNTLGVSSAQEGQTPTTGDGSFPDTYYVCSTACPGSGQSNALQNWIVGGIPLSHVNALVYKCGSITIDGN